LLFLQSRSRRADNVPYVYGILCQLMSPKRATHITSKSSSARHRRQRLASSVLLRSLIDENGRTEIGEVADAFGMSKTQLAASLGLSRESLYKAKRADAVKVQTRVREMLEVIVRVMPWAGGQQQAMAWYRAQPIPAFGDRTAESLVKEGRAQLVRDFLDFAAQGNFA
jgi:DNA-binding phage protein